MEKIALIGDIHFDRKAENPIIKKHIKEGQRQFFEFISKELKNRGVKTILMTGDLHHNRNVIDVESLVYTKRLLQTELKDFDIHIVLGNHDMYFENSYETTALELFEDIPNVTVYRKNVVKKELLGKQWYFVPWITTEKEPKFSEWLNNNAKNKENTV